MELIDSQKFVILFSLACLLCVIIGVFITLTVMHYKKMRKEKNAPKTQGYHRSMSKVNFLNMLLTGPGAKRFYLFNGAYDEPQPRIWFKITGADVEVLGENNGSKTPAHQYWYIKMPMFALISFVYPLRSKTAFNVMQDLAAHSAAENINQFEYMGDDRSKVEDLQAFSPVTSRPDPGARIIQNSFDDRGTRTKTPAPNLRKVRSRLNAPPPE
jgi:hypothetical protein